MVRRKKIDVRSSTIQNYQYCIKNWINPFLGNIKIEDITRKGLQDFVTEFSKTHKWNINITKPLSGSLKWAEENGYINTNPCNRIKISKDYSENEIKVFTQDEIESLLNAKGYKQVKKI